ncbi:MAG: hypothetical protein RIB41_11665 [Oceanibaculum nanhaiense]|uniref:hypothetical protein n=1 Tax=Oceanibaculum nanhaiense TaxID=1909734 RepID=UPI0032EF7BC9
MAEAENITIDHDEEGRDWKNDVLGVGPDGTFTWPSVECDESSRMSVQYAVGQQIARELIGHFIDYAPKEYEVEDRMADVLRTLVERGKFDSMALGFALTIGCWIARGSVNLGFGWEAHHGERP